MDNIDNTNEMDINNETPIEQSLTESTESSGKKKSRTTKPVRTFPAYSIREAMKIPKILGEKNAGNPWTPENIAEVMKISSASNSFFYLTSASRDYGFTIGTSRANKIELTSLGRKLVFPESPDEEKECILEAFLNIGVFKNVYEYYNQGLNLPEDKYLSNTLRETFNIDSSYHEDFIKIFRDNLDLLEKRGCSISRSYIISPLPQNKMVNESESNSSNILFVIMPFVEKTGAYPTGYFEEVYSSLIVPAAADAGFTAKTANRSGSDIIHSTIVSEIYNSEIILADLTEHNPNVLFELGLAIAFRKKVALIRAKGTPPIFDVDNLMRVYDYDGRLWKSTIERDIPNLSKHIRSTVQNDTLYLDILLKNQ